MVFYVRAIPAKVGTGFAGIALDEKSLFFDETIRTMQHNDLQSNAADLHPPLRRLTRAAGAVLCVLALAACESSTRLGSLLPDYGTAQRNSAITNPPPLTPAPSSEVESSSLPPPPGENAAGFPQTPAPPPASSSSVGTAPGNLPSPQVSTLPGATAPAPAAPSRTGLTGNWSLAEAAGNRCKITLSSAPKLDLYGANTQGCQSKELQRINAWELNGSEVVLYEPGGTVAARLKQAGSGYSGVSTRSGAPITLSK